MCVCVCVCEREIERERERERRRGNGITQGIDYMQSKGKYKIEFTLNLSPAKTSVCARARVCVFVGGCL